MEKYILDTNLFFNMEAGSNLGRTTEDVVEGLTSLIKNLKKKNKAEFLVPPRIIEEFLGFFQDKDQEFIKNFLSLVTVKSPDISSIRFPSVVFYQLVEEIRKRSYRGLTIAEEELQNAVKGMSSLETFNKKEFQINIGVFIKKLRERYRQATRVGFLDSLADLDIITLAKEQDGFLVSADDGVLQWGRIFGVKEMPVSLWLKRLQELF